MYIKMDGKSVVQSIMTVLSYFCSSIYASQLNLSQPTATLGHNFTLTCVVSTSGDIRFSMNDVSKCTMYTTANGGACRVVPLDNRFTYTCDPVDKQYTVNIPGTVIGQLHNSRWTCEVLYKEKPTSTVIYVNVPVNLVTMLSTPANTTVIVNENTLQQIECKTGPVRPPARIQWFISGQNVTSMSVPQQDECSTNCNDGLKISSSVLYYTGHKNDTGKSIYCTAMNIDGYLPTNSSVNEIEIYYGPSNISFSTLNESISIVENGTLGPVICNSSCHPSCTYTWSNHGFKTMTNTLHVTKIGRTQNGTYICTAKNSVNMSTKSFHVIVQYPPKVNDLTVSHESLIITEGSNITISCRTEGEPSPKISWKITDLLGQAKSLKTNDTGHSELQIDKTKCENSGSYLCTAKNDLEPSGTGKIDLNVTCVPRQNDSLSMNRSFIVQKNTFSKIYTYWISNPAPEVLWTLLDDPNNTISTSQKPITPILYTSVMAKTFVSLTTVVYKVVAGNSYGWSTPVYLEIVVNDTSTYESYTTSPTSDRYLVIAATTSTIIAIILVCLGVVTLRKYRKKKANESSGYNASSTASNSGYCSELDTSHIQTSGQRTSGAIKTTFSGNNVPIYAEVKKTKSGNNGKADDEIPFYCAVTKQKKKRRAQKESGKTSESCPVRNESESTNPTDPGLVYIQIDFVKNKKGKKFAIREQAERTEYGVIDFSKKADPLPSSDEENTIDH